LPLFHGGCEVLERSEDRVGRRPPELVSFGEGLSRDVGRARDRDQLAREERDAADLPLFQELHRLGRCRGKRVGLDDLALLPVRAPHDLRPIALSVACLAIIIAAATSWARRTASGSAAFLPTSRSRTAP